MRFITKQCAFLAFTAFFAVLAGFVFWGTWSLSVAPVMPDCAVSYPINRVAEWTNEWLVRGRFVPGDVIVFLGSPYFWTELQYVLALYCAALAMVYFLRGRAVAPLAAYGGGLFLAFSGYWCTLFSAGHFGWFQWMTYGVFAFGLIDRALAKNKMRHWLLLGAVLAWGSFYQPDLWLLFSVFQFFYFVFRAICVFRENQTTTFREKFLRLARGGACALVVFFAIGWPSFYSAIKHDLSGRKEQIARGETVGAATASDDEARWIFVTNWSMPPEAAREFFDRRCEGDTSCPFVLSINHRRGTNTRPYTGRLGRPLNAQAGNYRQHSLYVGWLTCLLALVGVASGIRRRQSTTLFFASAAILFFLCSLGRYCEGVYRVIYALPMGDYMRAPVKWHHLTEFAIVVLAAFGMNALLEKFREKRWIFFAIFFAIVVGSFDLASAAKIYCAPRPANADLQFAPSWQIREGNTRAQLRAHGIREIGELPHGGLTLLAKTESRKIREIQRPAVTALSLTRASLSLFATLGVLIFAIFSCVRDARKVRMDARK